ncbi:hypothetical protein DXG03_007682 [Asterophora parasitica]|uniref:Peptidase A1 domain-containing protein n=1 Tax=Asterophora parasitica TaxID=117018 RepID=A0A9P7KD19_9AGAR|nr:hypothetical protein DXG03_007682 [Asterophora parasitica]
MGYIHYAVLVAYLVALASAIRLDLHGVRNGRNIHHSRLQHRGIGSELNNSADVSYYADITIGGRRYTLLVDTGSSDLWVAGKVPNSNLTGVSGGVSYAVGAVSGPIKTAEVQLIGFTIPDQAFLEIEPDQENKAGEGIIGLGPNDGSNIYQEIGNAAGAALIDRIFLQNQSMPTYITVLLGRSEDPTDFYSGSLTIGEVLNDFEDVLKQPKLPVVYVPHERSDQHFQVLLDENGLIGPDGKPIPIISEVESASNRKQATVVLDTGFSLPQVPKRKSHDYRTSEFGGFKRKTYVYWDSLNDDQFQPFSYNRGSNPNYDMVLGMAFLRNVYTLLDYGDLVVGSYKKEAPYVQFLATTEVAEAHSDFVEVRQNGIDSTPPNSGLKKRGVRPMVYYIVIITIVIGVLAFLGVFLLYRKRKARRLAAEAASTSPLPPNMSPPPFSTSPPNPPPQSYHPQQYGQPIPPHMAQYYPHQPPFVTQPPSIQYPQSTVRV